MAKHRILNLYCVDTVGRGGTEIWVQGLIRSLAKDYEVRLISGSLDPAISQQVSQFVKIWTPSKPAFLRVFCYSILSTFVFKSNASVNHVVGAITFRKSNLNTIHFYHKENFRLRRSTIYKNSNKFRVVNRLLYTLLCIIMEKIIYSKFFSTKLASVSPEMCALLERDFGRTVYLTHNGINLSDLQNKISSSNVPFLLFVGGDWERKGLLDILECLSFVKKSFPSIKLHVAGSGNLKHYLAISRELGIEKNITWMGRVPRNEIPYSKNSILISASTFEVSPLIFLEAGMSGAPVVSYPVFGTTEAVEDGYLRVCDATPKGMAEVIVDLLSDVSQMSEMSVKGVQLRISKNWDSVVRETLELYPE